MFAPSDDRLIGQTIDGRFRLDRLLGAGGMGKVYHGIQLSVGRPVAVKVLRSDLSEIPSLQQRFFREAQVLASLHHPNIVGLVDFGRDDTIGALYMAMQFVDGRSLTDLVKAGRLPLEVSISIARQICSGLAEAHAAGIVHRDLKPDNVMLQTTAEGTVVAKLLDFGIALPTGRDETRLTATGGIVGTPHYMSPEQAQDMQVGPTSDLYAVGVILYEMITGKVPFSADTPLAVLFKTVNERHTPVQELLDSPRVRGPLANLIDELLDKDPSKRPASASEVARQLGALLAELEVPHMKSVEALDAMLQPAVEIARDADATSRGTQTQPAVPTAAIVGGLLLMVGLAIVMVLVAAGLFFMKWDKVDEGYGAVSQAPQELEIESVELPEPPRSIAIEEPAAAKPAAAKPAAAKPVTKPSKTPRKLDTKPPKTPDPVKKTRSSRKKRTAKSGACQNRTCAVNLTTKDAHYACQNATCSVDCSAGGCGQVCQAESTCTFECSGGGCRQSCFGGTTCILSCAGGDCDRTAFSGADVTERD